MASPYENIPNELKEEALKQEKEKKIEKTKQRKESTKESKKRILFKKTRAGVSLSNEEIKKTRIGRKKLRKELKKKGIKSKEEFEIMATSLGLYFDKSNSPLVIFLKSHLLGTLLASLGLLITVLFIFAQVQQMRGLYTINLSSGLYSSGFVLSETSNFSYPSSQLFGTVADLKDCESFQNIPADLYKTDGSHNSDRYFAYTFYLKNEGDYNVDYSYKFNITSSTGGAEEAVWYLIYMDDTPSIYAKANAKTNGPEVLKRVVDGREIIVSYASAPLIEANPKSEQFEKHKRTDGRGEAYRVIPYTFESDKVVATGVQQSVAPGETHKYTVVLWLEGDDPEATEKIKDTHVGSEAQFMLLSENIDEGDARIDEQEERFGIRFKELFDSLLELLGLR